METEKAKELFKKIVADRHSDELAEKLQDADKLSDYFDSLDAVEMAMEIEKATGSHISDEEIEKWNTVGDVIASIEKLTLQ